MELLIQRAVQAEAGDRIDDPVMGGEAVKMCIIQPYLLDRILLEERLLKSVFISVPGGGMKHRDLPPPGVVRMTGDRQPVSSVVSPADEKEQRR